MRVAVGTVELDDDILKSIRRQKGLNGKATRDEAREWVFSEIQRATTSTVSDFPPGKRPTKVVVSIGDN